MIFFILIFLLIIFNGAEFSPKDGFNESYMDRKTTSAVNGIFVVLVFLGHYSQYADLGGTYDDSYLVFRKHLSQMVVVTFLFYSGYGMMESIRIKGRAYIKGLISKTLMLLMRFDIAVVLFIILRVCLGTNFSVKHILTSLIGWNSVGNSNWYIFDILIMYMLMFAAFMPLAILKKEDKERDKRPYFPQIAVFFALTLLFIYVLKSAGKDSWWYNTVVMLPLGALYSEFRGPIEKLVMRSDLSYFAALTVSGGVYILSFLNRWDSLLIYDIWAAAFMLCIVLFTMKVSIGNGVLDWLGNHVFSVYILQRLPMLVLKKMGYIESHKYMSLIVVLLVTVIMAEAFDIMTGRLENLIRRQGKKNT